MINEKFNELYKELSKSIDFTEKTKFILEVAYTIGFGDGHYSSKDVFFESIKVNDINVFTNYSEKINKEIGDVLSKPIPKGDK